MLEAFDTTAVLRIWDHFIQAPTVDMCGKHGQWGNAAENILTIRLWQSRSAPACLYAQDLYIKYKGQSDEKPESGRRHWLPAPAPKNQMEADSAPRSAAWWPSKP